MATHAKLLFLFSLSSLFMSQSGVNGKTVCHAPMDAIIVLDASGSVGLENWQKSVNFTSDLGHSILDFHSGNKVGVVEFSQVANEAVPLTDNKNIFDSGVKVLVENYQNGRTRTELGLSKAADMFKRESILMDDRLLVIVTDGKTTPIGGQLGIERIAQPTADLKNLGVHVIVVGVTENINLEELNLMATDPDSKNVLKMSNYDKLLKHVNTISRIACPAEVTTTPTAIQPQTQPTTPRPIVTYTTTPAAVTSPSIPFTTPTTAACDIRYEKLGCYKDDQSNPRPMNELILTDRDTTAAVYSGHSIDWGNWDAYLVDLVCRCARKAAENKYNYFGIQYYGECWSSAKAGDTFSNDGITDTCITYGYNACPTDPKANNDQCAGKEYTNYVYGIRTAAPKSKCSVKYERVGCYNDNHFDPRPLPDLILTDRDATDKVYGNVSTDWGNWDSYIDDLVCRCARVAQNKRYTYFGVQNYGECWSGPKAAGTYNNNGESTNCITDGYQTCKPSSTECVGEEKTNFVYKVTCPELMKRTGTQRIV